MSDMLTPFTWYKQSAFRWRIDDFVVYIDPWGLSGDAPPADMVLITHAHADHFSTEDIARVQSPKTVFVAPADVAGRLSGDVRSVKPGDSVDARGVAIDAVPAYNIEPHRLQKHPKENNWVGYVLRLGGYTYYHAGDTDHLPELEHIRTDVAFLPIGNGASVMSPVQAAALAKIMKPRIAVPMHYGFFPGVGVASDAERFREAASGIDVRILSPLTPFAFH